MKKSEMRAEPLGLGMSILGMLKRKSLVILYLFNIVVIIQSSFDKINVINLSYVTKFISFAKVEYIDH